MVAWEKHGAVRQRRARRGLHQVLRRTPAGQASHKELAPRDPDWYFIRAASIARKLYFSQDIGVGRFRRIYGGRNKRRGTRPEKKAIASAGLIRHILIQMEKLGLVEKSENDKGGRRLTSKGQKDMDIVAGGISVKPVTF